MVKSEKCYSLCSHLLANDSTMAQFNDKSGMANETKIYLATFLSPSETSAKTGPGPCVAKFEKNRQSVSNDDWPYDFGDDPSFFCMRRLHGNLTWGICRPDVRNNLGRGDIVVFFSFREETKTETGTYQLCAIATVKTKVSQTEIWLESGLEEYRGYCNLLIRPAAQGDRGLWKHHEPCLYGSQTHKDWLWRIAKHSGLRKRSFDEIQKRNGFRFSESVSGRPIEIEQNYVIFSSDPKLTRVMSRPPVVASYTKGLPAEQWETDRFVQSLKCLTLDAAANSTGRIRFLRTRNRQQPHRHVVWSMTPSEAVAWREELLKITARF